MRGPTFPDATSWRSSRPTSMRWERDSASTGAARWVSYPLSGLEATLRTVLERVRSHVLSGKGPYVPRGFEEAVRVAAPDAERYFLPRATAVYSEQGGITGASVILQDVTRLRRVDELRNDLVATVAHEFRTPLTSLRMAIHMCLEQTAGRVTDNQ